VPHSLYLFAPRLNHAVKELVIVDDFHIVSIPPLPPEADPILVIDPNTVLSLPVALEGFQPKSRQIQITERRSGVEDFQSDTCGLLDRLKTPAEFPLQKPLCILVSTRADHTFSILRYAYYGGKRALAMGSA
jgi:hypothetical protein